LTIEAGKTFALCGPSGEGKSTIVSLVLRFYDPLAGEILLDGIPYKDINLKSLRASIGYVGQEPVLFSGAFACLCVCGLNMQTPSLNDGLT
jgi:ATP-binding cassette subfamily B (MDR/TAP) protein 1